MSDIYKCECGHTVHTDSKEPPKSLNWSDGHICTLIKQENEDKFDVTELEMYTSLDEGGEE